MPRYICVTCGNQYAATDQPPLHCPICEDDRQYVGHQGQSWITLDELARGHDNVFNKLELGLTEISTTPKFAIGQRALLVQTQYGNVLWDCLSLIDSKTIDAIKTLGGISALAMSHPHMFASMVEWSHAFGNAPIYLHGDFRKWVQRPDPVIEFWDSETRKLNEDVTLYRCGGHFDGSTVLHWSEGAEGRGALLTSDTLYVTQDRRYVSFMYSYPNYIPLSAPTIDRIVETVMPIKFDRIHSHFANLTIDANAKEAVRRSAIRYKKAIGAD